MTGPMVTATNSRKNVMSATTQATKHLAVPSAQQERLALRQRTCQYHALMVSTLRQALFHAQPARPDSSAMPKACTQFAFQVKTVALSTSFPCNAKPVKSAPDQPQTSLVHPEATQLLDNPSAQSAQPVSTART